MGCTQAREKRWTSPLLLENRFLTCPRRCNQREIGLADLLAAITEDVDRVYRNDAQTRLPLRWGRPGVECERTPKLARSLGPGDRRFSHSRYRLDLVPPCAPSEDADAARARSAHELSWLGVQPDI